MTAAVSVRAEDTIAGLRRLAFNVDTAVQQTLRAVVAAAQYSAQHTDLFRDRSGETRRSISSRVSSRRGFVKAGGVAKFLESGTKPHRIEAKNARALRFVVGGHVIYRRWVSHPGAKPRPFMRQARDFAVRMVGYAAQEFIGTAIRRAR